MKTSKLTYTAANTIEAAKERAEQAARKAEDDAAIMRVLAENWPEDVLIVRARASIISAHGDASVEILSERSMRDLPRLLQALPPVSMAKRSGASIAFKPLELVTKKEEGQDEVHNIEPVIYNAEKMEGYAPTAHVEWFTKVSGLLVRIKLPMNADDVPHYERLTKRVGDREEFDRWEVTRRPAGSLLKWAAHKPTAPPPITVFWFKGELGDPSDIADIARV